MKTTRDEVINTEDIDAFIFDMDGVVTDTASIHTKAWKQLFDEYLQKRARQRKEPYRAFDAGTDYSRYIDGKPRYDGISSFLKSRGISLPYGDPSDDIDKETICGLGNRKNTYYLERLKKQGIKPYQSSVKLIRKLRASGIRTAIISSSRNCDAVLEAANVREFFDVKVDGIDSAELGIKGKPDPDIFFEAARGLGVDPGKSAIIEDSLAGVEAGRKGRFKLVIGVDRAGHGEELKKRGADVVVNDLGEIRIRRGNRTRKPAIPEQTLADLQYALERKGEIFRRLWKGTPAIFLDYDGTLTPIVNDPANAILAEETRAVIRRLSERWSVAIISGRDLTDVQNMVDIADIVYAGSHGFDIVGPGGSYRDQKRGERFLPALGRAEVELQNLLKDIPGARVERKRFTIAVHYRQVDDANVEAVQQCVDQVLSQHPELRKSFGKKVFELRPDIDWDKGKALLSLIEALYDDSGKVVPIYIGDDVTDEDAFRAIRNKGISIVVGNDDRRTAAHYALRDTDEVRAFLADLADLGEGRSP